MNETTNDPENTYNVMQEGDSPAAEIASSEGVVAEENMLPVSPIDQMRQDGTIHKPFTMIRPTGSAVSIIGTAFKRLKDPFRDRLIALALSSSDAADIVQIAGGSRQKLNKIICRLEEGWEMSRVQDYYNLQNVLGKNARRLTIEALLKLEEAFSDVDFSQSENMECVIEHVYDEYERSGYSGPMHSLVNRLLDIKQQWPDVSQLETAVDLYKGRKGFKSAIRTNARYDDLQDGVEEEDGFYEKNFT